MDLAELAKHVRETSAAQPDRRLIVGLIGAPGVGKSTAAEHLLRELGSSAVELPMDGFHLSNAVLVSHGTRERKGAPETFDADGFVDLLRRVRADDQTSVYAPRFHREIEESIAAEIEIAPEHRVVIAEGNYLLLDTGAWNAGRELIDVAVFLDVDEEVRLARLIERHIQYGKSPEAARAWALGSDQANAELIFASAHRADLRVELTDF